MRGNITINIPQQEKPSRDSFDARPAAVKKWVNQIPMADRGAATREVFRVLREVNRLVLSSQHRFEFMEAIAKPAAILLTELERHFSSGEFPLSEKRQHIANLSTKFFSELIIGYRIILNTETTGKKLFRMANKPMWVVSVQRIFCYFSGIISNFRRLDLLFPKGFWLEVHRLFHVIDQFGWRAEKVVTIKYGRGKITLEDEYKRLLLRSLIPLHHLRQEQVIEVREFLDEHLGDAVLTGLNVADLGEVFCLRSDIDFSPEVFDESCFNTMDGADVGLAFDTRALTAKIDSMLEQCSDEYYPLKQGGKISRNALDTLYRCWTPELSDRELRHYSNEKCKLIVGMSAINILIAREGNDEGDNEEPQQVVDEGLEFTLQALPKYEARKFNSAKGLINSYEEKGDVWKMPFQGRVQQPEHWASQTVIIGYDNIAGRLVNYSETGYCIMIPNREVSSIRLGELIAVRLQDQNSWQLTALRWLQQGGMDSYLLGLELIATHTLPVHLLIESSSGASEPVTAMIGLDRASKPLLLLHYFPGIEKKSLTLDYRGGKVAIELEGKQLYTPVIDGFYFHEQQRDMKVPSAIQALKHLQAAEPGFIEVRD